MLHRTLPSVVLSIVLEKATHVPDRKIGDFCNALPLLAVCRQWRHLALPIVYADAYYLYRSECFLWYDYDNDWPLPRESVSTRERTNLRLITSARCVNTVRRVHISMKCEGRPHGGILAVATRLREVAAVWPRVEYLAFDNAVLQHSFQVDEARTATDMLIGMYPGVRQLDLEYLSNNGSNGLGGLLAAGYAKQLRRYKGDPVALPRGCVLRRLERATVTYWADADHSGQRIQPSTLQHLRLEIHGAGHPWDMFVGDISSGDRNVEFSNLKSLMVSFPTADPHVAIARHPQLHFPQLQYLNLQYRGNAHGLLQHAVFPAHMARFVLRAPAPAFESLCGVELPVVEQLTVTFNSDLPEPNALVHVGRFLSMTRGGKQELTICCSAARLLPLLVPCTRLTSVKVSTQVRIGLVKSFIAGLQFLETLEFAKVRMDKLPADMRIANMKKRKPLEPLNTSLRTLSLVFRDKCKARAKAAVAKYFLVQLPNLTLFSVAGVPVKPVHDFAREYSQFYPHLKNAVSVFRSQLQL